MRVAFSLVGGEHQFLHGVPVAAALSQREGVSVVAYTCDAHDAAALRAMVDRFGGQRVDIVEMRLPRWLEYCAARLSHAPTLKTVRLLRWACAMRACDVLVALERTSSLLKRLPGRCPALVHIPHGVGGARRAGGGGVDPRFALFDLALVAGRSDYRSTLELGLLRPDQVEIVGHVKLSGLQRLGMGARRLFANDKPTILYNPHFHPRRGSWDRFAEPLIREIGARGRFNLIVAPHVRLFRDADPAERARWEALGDPDWLIVDTGSSKSVDMTYLLGADIYLGDFSSQVFEWMADPRPCVFIDQLGDGGADDTKLPVMWNLGERVSDLDAALVALERSQARHPEFAAAQREAMLDATGDPALPADEMAADRILALVDERRGVGTAANPRKAA